MDISDGSLVGDRQCIFRRRSSEVIGAVDKKSLEQNSSRVGGEKSKEGLQLRKSKWFA